MIFPSWRRLVDLYEQDIMQILATSKLPWGVLPDTKKFQKAAYQAARAMVQEVAVVNASSWRTAAMKAGRGRSIYEALQQELDAGGWGKEAQEITARNAKLISSVPKDVAKKLTALAADMRKRGARQHEIEAALKVMAPQLAESRIRLIARTEVSRAETDLTRFRAEKLGLEWYQWQTAEDQRVRPSHANMDLVLVAWDDAPQPEKLIGEKSTLGKYHAGSCPNCRCLCLPVLSVAEIKWPARVHFKGKLVKMSSKQFQQIAGLPAAA